MKERQEIENLLKSGKISEAKANVKSLIESRPDDVEAKLWASEILKEMTEYKAAFDLLGDEGSSLSDPNLEFRRKIQIIRILNKLGASSFALKTAWSLQKTTRDPQVHSKLIDVFTTNYDFASGLQSCAALNLNSNSFLTSEISIQVSYLAWAQCKFALGQTHDALEIVNFVMGHSRNEYMAFMCRLALASFYIKLRKLNHAKSIFDQSSIQSLRKFPRLDRAVFENFRAGYLILKKDHDRAHKLLSRIMPIAYVKGVKPEVWLSVLFWHGLNSYLKTGEFSKQWKILAAYPSPSRYMIGRIEEFANLPENMIIGNSRDSTQTIDFESDLVRAKNGEMKLGLGIVEKMIGHLRAAGPYGIPQFRVYDLLWENEAFSFPQLQKRLEQIVMRSRVSNYKVRWTGYHLFCASEKICIRFSGGPNIPGKIFLLHTPQFTRKQVEDFFKISRSRAHELCRSWIDLKVAKSQSNGSKSGYKSLLARK